MKKLTFFFILFILSPFASAETSTEACKDTLSWDGRLSFDSRHFILRRDNFPTNSYQTLEGEVSARFDNHNNFKATLTPRVKVDFMDHDRDRFVPNEFHVTYYQPRWNLNAGINRVNWGILNFYPIVDGLNRRDFEDHFYNPEKLGDVLVQLELQPENLGGLENQSLKFLVMPVFLETPLPELDTRFQLQGRVGAIPYSLFDSQDQPSWARGMTLGTKYQASIGPNEFSLISTWGPERNPAYRVIVDNSGLLRLQPTYYDVLTLGQTWQLPYRSFRFYVESALKITSLNDSIIHDVAFENDEVIPESYYQFVPGVEYQASLGSDTLTTTVEYYGDTARKDNLQNFRPFQNDVVLGIHYLFNDRRRSQFRLASALDLGNSEMAMTASASSFVHDKIELAVDGYWIVREVGLNTPLSFFENNSSVDFKINYYF